MGSLYGDSDIGKWLGEIFSGMKMGYDDSFLHQKWLNQVFLCKSVCIVITSL